MVDSFPCVVERDGALDLHPGEIHDRFEFALPRRARNIARTPNPSESLQAVTRTRAPVARVQEELAVLLWQFDAVLLLQRGQLVLSKRGSKSVGVLVRAEEGPTRIKCPEFPEFLKQVVHLLPLPPLEPSLRSGTSRR